MSVEILIAVVASVCVMQLSTVVPASTPALALAGAVLGAAIPPFVSTAGRRRGLRVTMALVVTVAAVGVTYAGTFVVDTVTRQETLPGSNALGNALSRSSSGDDGTSYPNAPGSMKVTPGALSCAPDCGSPVAIQNTGSASFVIEGIDFQGEDEASFSHDGNCVHVDLGEGEQCEFTVAFNADGTDGDAAATLHIRNDLTADQATVDVTGHSPPPEVDFAIASDVRCTYEAAGGGEATLFVAFYVTLTGTDGPGQIPVAVSSNRGPSQTSTAFAGENADETVVTLSVGDAYGNDHMIKINVDPDNEIPEADEDNNDVEASCAT